MRKIISILLCAVILFTLGMPVFAADTPTEDSLPYEDSEFFTYGDYTLHYRVQSAQDAKGQIMFLHGFAASTFCWENLAAILVENGYTCVLVDLPDFGFSSRETKDTDRHPYEEVIHALMVALSDEPWYLAGHSMGGYVALAVAQTYPESVKNLLLYSSAGNNGLFNILKPLTTKDKIASFVGPIIERIGTNRFLVKLLMSYATNDRDYLADYDLEAIMAPFRIKGTGAGIIYYLNMQTDTDYDAVSRMAPILYINGDRDGVLPPAERIKIRAVLPEGSVDYTMKGVGHMLIENRAEETARITLDFLSNNP
ncbi:MAG: alpha/beta hydrolase [Clostridia bacterium]|nr:alpha/beta hydrolase [Clostridia bacterium]